GVAGSFASRPRVRTSDSRPPRSSPAAGSSSSSSSGSVISARAASTRLRSPVERVANMRPARSPTPKAASRVRARSRSSASYSSRQRPTTPYPAVTTTFSAVSCAGTVSASSWLARPISGRSSKMSTRPSCSPRISTVPSVGCRRAASRRTRVDLPAPLGPSTAQRSPSSTSSETASRIVVPLRRTVTSFRAAAATDMPSSLAVPRPGSGPPPRGGAHRLTGPDTVPQEVPVTRRPVSLHAPRGSVAADELRAGIDALLAEQDGDVPLEFPAEVLAAAEDAAARATATQGRADRTDVPFVTLDPESSTDLDQAMHLERTESGFRVLYAIADVPWFVDLDGPLDQEARRRGETLYLPD